MTFFSFFLGGVPHTIQITHTIWWEYHSLEDDRGSSKKCVVESQKYGGYIGSVVKVSTIDSLGGDIRVQLTKLNGTVAFSLTRSSVHLVPSHESLRINQKRKAKKASVATQPSTSGQLSIM
jgi:hypothetical protein